MQHELFDDLQDHRLRQRCKGDDGIQTVAEFRRERAFDRGGILALPTVTAKANRRFRLFCCPCVRGHDQDHIAEADGATIVVGQRAVVHHLQQDVVDIRVCLFDLVKQQHTMRMLVDTIGELTTLIEPDISRRRADQTADRVFLHVFGHVEAEQFHTQRIRQLLCHLGFTHTGRTREEVVADGLFRFPQAGPCQFDRRRQRFDGGILPEDHALERRFEILKHLCIVLGHVLWRDAGDLGHNGLDFLGTQRLAPLGFRDEMLGGACFVDYVDRLVGQLAVVDVPRGQFHSGLDRLGGVLHTVVFLEIGLEALEDLDRVFDRGFVHVNLLEPTAERAVLFEVLTEFLVCRGPHTAQLAALKRGLQQVGRIHCAARGRPRTDHGVDLVDEQHRIIVIFEFRHHGFQTFLEIAAIPCAGQQCAHVE